jgi:tripartite-type tricarboxylate transporter receptor subunit TctC
MAAAAVQVRYRPASTINCVAYLVVAALALILPQKLLAQTFPSRAITIVVPYAPGGAADETARIIGEAMARILRQHVVIENVSGGSAVIGTGRVVRAAPDGYTLLVHQLALAANVSLLPKTSFNVEKDLAAVGLINYSPMLVVGRKSLPADSISELAAWLKQPGRQARVANAGTGSSSHLCGVLFAQSVGAAVDIIPYRGAAPSLVDLIAGHVDLYCTPAGIAAEHVKAGNVKAFGVASKERLDEFPGIPSLVRSGFAELDIPFWQGMFAPAGTTAAILDKLNGALRLALSDPKVVGSFAQRDYHIFPESRQTTAAAEALLHAEIGRWREVVRANHLEPPP